MAFRGKVRAGGPRDVKWVDKKCVSLCSEDVDGGVDQDDRCSFVGNAPG